MIGMDLFNLTTVNRINQHRVYHVRGVRLGLDKFSDFCIVVLIYLYLLMTRALC